VQYHQLIPMLLNELQRQQQQMARQSQQLDVQARGINQLEAQNAALLVRLARLEERAELTGISTNR
jgi:hypothetical protein